MALKFLNKKGWHTGSLRNIENVWKAEQKHEAEERKLDELRKQIQEERERSEFRLLQEQAGLLPKQERLDFLYDSGLAVGKGSNSSSTSKTGEGGVAFKALEPALPTTAGANVSFSGLAKQSSSSSSSVPGALFEDKPHSANDAWRKLHSDPLLLIRQREQEALARIKNNPVQMSLIRKSAEANKGKEKACHKKEHRKRHSHSRSKHHKCSLSKQQSDPENDGVEEEGARRTHNFKGSKYDEHYRRAKADLGEESGERGSRRRKEKDSYRGSKYRERSPNGFSDTKAAKNNGQHAIRENHDMSENERHLLKGRADLDADRKGKETRNFFEVRSQGSAASVHHDSQYNRRNSASKLSEEERAARLQEMQMDAELHEEQRWKRLRKAEDDDAREVTHANRSGGRNFLDAAQKSVYGAEKGGSSTIEESVRRRTHYLQGRSEVGDGNAFRR